MREVRPSVVGVGHDAGDRRGRRRFLQQVSAGAAAALGAPRGLGAGASDGEEAPPSAAPLPTLELGRYRLKVHDFVKKAHDAGVLAGVSSHNPANVAYVEEKGWENDFFMTCFYNVTRPAEEIRSKLGTVPLGEPFLESDRDQTSAVVRQVKRPCHFPLCTFVR